MNNYKIETLRQDFLVKTKDYGLDDQNQSVVYVDANGDEPCRDVLRRAYKGEKLILASYCPFSKPSPYKEYGAVFLLRNYSNESVDLTKLPEISENEQSYLPDRFILRGYDKREFIIESFMSYKNSVHEDIERIWSNKDIQFILVRSPTHSCYYLRINRWHSS